LNSLLNDKQLICVMVYSGLGSVLHAALGVERPLITAHHSR